MAYVQKTSGTISADGSTDAITVEESNNNCVSQIWLHLSGTFGSGTVTLEFYAEDSSWKAMSNASFTAAIDKDIPFPADTDLRLTTTGSTTPSIYWQISSNGPTTLEV